MSLRFVINSLKKGFTLGNARGGVAENVGGYIKYNNLGKTNNSFVNALMYSTKDWFLLDIKDRKNFAEIHQNSSYTKFRL